MSTTIGDWVITWSACHCCEPPGCVLHGGKALFVLPPCGIWLKTDLPEADVARLIQEKGDDANLHDELTCELLGIPW